MRFMMLVKHAENYGSSSKGFMEVMAKLGEEAVKAGTMVISGGLARPPQVRVCGFRRAR
jgi:hypothetical protein